MNQIFTGPTSPKKMCPGLNIYTSSSLMWRSFASGPVRITDDDGIFMTTTRILSPQKCDKYSNFKSLSIILLFSHKTQHTKKKKNLRKTKALVSVRDKYAGRQLSLFAWAFSGFHKFCAEKVKILQTVWMNRPMRVYSGHICYKVLLLSDQEGNEDINASM